MDYFRILPAEITIDILSRVPAEFVLECKSVCTNWRNVISHPSFSKVHFHHLNNPSTDDDSGMLTFLASTYDIYHNKKLHYIEYVENHESTLIHRIRRMNSTPPFKHFSFLGSFNGLICLAEGQSVCICNPITKEYVMVPEIKRNWCEIERFTFASSSFGYLSSTNEYKVVRIYLSKTNVEVHIYTVGSGKGWRNLGKVNFQFSIDIWDVAGVFANGALHWLDDKLGKIVTFDLNEEKFCESRSAPPLPPESNWWYSRIGVLDGFLFYSSRLVVQGIEGFETWLLKRKMNDEHDMKERDQRPSLGWSKEFRIDDCKLLAITKRDCVLTYIDNYLHIYDTKASTSKRIVEFKEMFRNVFPHRNTLVSLKVLGEEDTKTMESVGIEETERRD